MNVCLRKKQYNHIPIFEKSDFLSIVPFQSAKKNFERDYCRTLLIKFNGNILRSAQASGIKLSYLSKRVKAMGLSKEKVVDL